MKNVFKKIWLSAATVVIMLVTGILIVILHGIKFWHKLKQQNIFRNLPALRIPRRFSLAALKGTANQQV